MSHHDGVEICFEKLAKEGFDDLVKHAKSDYTSKLLKTILLKPMKQRKSQIVASAIASGSMDVEMEDDEDNEKEENNWYNLINFGSKNKFKMLLKMEFTCKNCKQIHALN